jgi:Uma2 family endonuclease
MSIDDKIMTADEFYEFANLPENATRKMELINGEIIEVPSNAYVSYISGIIIYLINSYLKSQGLKGYVTGEAGGFALSEDVVVAPDVAYTDKEPARSGFEPSPPLLAVEVISNPKDSKEQSALRRKLALYQEAGVVLWVVDYTTRTVEVYNPSGYSEELRVGNTLTAETILPGFAVPLREIFDIDDD